MEPKKRKHYRISIKNVHATPKKGIYVTKDEATQLCAYGFILFIILAIFPRKK